MFTQHVASLALTFQLLVTAFKNVNTFLRNCLGKRDGSFPDEMVWGFLGN